MKYEIRTKEEMGQKNQDERVDLRPRRSTQIADKTVMYVGSITPYSKPEDNNRRGGGNQVGRGPARLGWLCNLCPGLLPYVTGPLPWWPSASYRYLFGSVRDATSCIMSVRWFVRMPVVLFRPSRDGHWTGNQMDSPTSLCVYPTDNF